MATPTVSLPPSAVSATTTATCITATPDKYGYVPPEACNSYYNYYPNFSANLAFAALFGLTTAVHIVQAIIFKKVRMNQIEPSL